MSDGATINRLIGFGCMPFEIPQTSPARVWVGAVQEALSQIATVSNMAIKIPKDALGDEVAVESDDSIAIPDDNVRPWFWPEPDFTSITFDVRIPHRMQPELGMFSTAGAEHFRVLTVYGFHGPCTFVSVLDGSDPDEVSPSTAVGIVHGFLSRELARQGGPVRMARVGPSPFHMDAELIEGPNDQIKPLIFERLGRAGYERVRFTYHPGVFDSIDEAEKALQHSLQGQLELFYYMERLTNIQQDDAQKLRRASSALVAKHSLTGPKGWFTRLFATASDARRLGLQVLDYQTRSAQQSDTFERWTRDELAQSKTVPIFEDSIRRISEDDSPSLTANVGEVVRFVEAGRRSEFEVLMLSAATLLGGLAGGLVGLLVAAGGGA